MKKKVILIDAGTGNLMSVNNALKHLDLDVTITNEASKIMQGRSIVLPGVGAFGNFMSGLENNGLIDAIKETISKEIPLLGICVGMQALFDFSEEMGKYAGLAAIPGKVSRFEEQEDYKIPQTGWNQIWPTINTVLLNGIKPGDYAYFNHSYYCIPTNPEDTAATTDYCTTFTSIVQKNNLCGVQFHPEKSQQIGLMILSNFMEL